MAHPGIAYPESSLNNGKETYHISKGGFIFVA